MRTQTVARKIARYAEGLGFTVEQHGSGISESMYLTLWYASVLALPLYIRISGHPASPAAVRKHGLADFEIGSHSARCTDMAECVRWLRSITGRELPPKLAVSMQHTLHQTGSNMLITLYHFCGQAAYTTLQQRGYLNGDGRRVDRFLRDMEWQPYHWMAEQMERRLPRKPANAGKFPVWAWHTHGGKHPPDLRCAGLGTKGERTVMLTIQLPATQVLLSDHEEWHIVLNNGPCTDTEPEWEQWNAFEKVWPAERYTAAMRISWEKIFDPGRPCAPEWRGNPERSYDYIQACLWVVEQSMVRSERWFIAK
jgi:hypothetical protein